MKKKIKPLVSLQERLDIQKNMVEQIGTVIKYPVMDLKKVTEKIKADRKAANMSPYVEIRPISPDKYKDRSRLNTYQKDRKTGVYYGLPISVDEFGNIKWQKILMTDHMTLNLDNENDVKVWAVIRFHPSIKGSPFQEETPYYYVYDPVDEADANANRIENMEKAFAVVRELLKDPVLMVKFVRSLGVELQDNSNYKIVKSALYTEAEKNPVEFMNSYKDKEGQYKRLFHSAVAIGTIQEDSNSGFMYEKIPLGITEEDSINFLKKDGTLAMSIDEKVKQDDPVMKEVKKTKDEKEEEEKTE
jgi:hypothetical protein